MSDEVRKTAAHTQENLRRLKFPVRVLLGIAAAGALLLAAGWCSFASFSVCRMCGQVRHEIRWQLPFMDVTYLRVHRDEETVASRFLNSRGLVGEHEHDWIFGHGGGNGRSACGPMSSMPGRLQDEERVRFLDILLKFGRREEAAKWACRIADPRQILLPSPPDSELKTEKEFESWWRASLELCEDPAGK